MRCVGPATERIASCCAMAVMLGKVIVSVLNLHLFCPFLHICPAVLAVIGTVTSQQEGHGFESWATQGFLYRRSNNT